MELRNPNELKIVGLDKDTGGKSHHLWDERAQLEVPKTFLDNIKEFGVIEPVVVNEQNEVVEGRTRVKACRQLKIQVPCILATHDNHEALQHSANIHRQDDRPTVIAAKAIRMLLRDNQSKQAVAATFGVSVKQVENYQKFMELDSKVRNQVDKSATGDQKGRKLTMTDAIKHFHGLSKADQESNLEDVQAGRPPGVKAETEGNGESAGDVTFNYYANKHVNRIAKLFMIEKGVNPEKYGTVDQLDPKVVAAWQEAEGLSDEFLWGVVVAKHGWMNDFALNKVKGLKKLIRALDTNGLKMKKEKPAPATADEQPATE